MPRPSPALNRWLSYRNELHRNATRANLRTRRIEAAVAEVLADLGFRGVERYDPKQPRDTDGQWTAGLVNPLDLPVDEIDPWRVTPWNEVVDTDKFNRLVTSMREDGWRGPPVVVIPGKDHGWGPTDPMAITGSHRIAAAREAEIDVPTVDLEDMLHQHGTSLAAIDEKYGVPEDDESHEDAVRMLPYELPADVVDTYGLDTH